MSIQSEYLTLSKYPHTSNKLSFIDFNQTKKRNAIIPYLFKTLPLPPVKIHPINTPMSAPSRSYLHEYTHPSVYFLSRTCRTHLLCVWSAHKHTLPLVNTRCCAANRRSRLVGVEMRALKEDRCTCTCTCICGGAEGVGA